MQLKYPAEHWASDPDPASGLAKYLALRQKTYHIVKNDILFSLLPQNMNGLSVLDYGCGAGWFSIACAKRGSTVTGIDASEHAIASARLYASNERILDRCNFITGTDVHGGSFDVVLAKDVIEHIEDDSKFLREIADVLKPNGQLILATQNNWSLNYLIEGSYQRYWCGNTRWMGWDSTHYRFYSPTSLKRLVETSGLVVERWASMYIVPYNIVSWLLLLRRTVIVPSLRYVDYLLGKVYPFNRLGWAIIVRCRKR